MPATDRSIATGRGVEGSIAGRRYRLGQPAYALELCALSAAAPDTVIATAEPGSWIVLANTSGPVCRFRLDDELRADAAATVAALQRRGLAVHLLSGDHSAAVLQLGTQLRIDAIVAGATPEHKLRYLEMLQRAGRRVLMIGDGINDIPVLAAAAVSVAMSNASQLAKTSADCILLTPRLARLETLLDCARATRNVIHQNIAWALLYNGAAVPLAATGLISPWLGALGMSLSSLLVVGNALRLRNAAGATDTDFATTE
jgi:Cu2+-exporting ATPase